MSAQTPVLSIVVASHNQLNSLKFTLLTLRDQPPAVTHEIIVVDCDSQDDTVQFLAGQAEKGHLRVINERAANGRTAARNHGAKIAQGRYIMFLDPGVVMGPHWSESLLATLDHDPVVGAVAGKVILPDGLIDHAGLAVLEMPTEKGARLMGRSIHAGQRADIQGSLRSLNVQGLAGEAIMVRAAAFFAVGGFDDGLGREFGRMKPTAEAEPSGLDLSLRLGERGWSRVYRHQSIMTRLRVTEAEAQQDEVAANRTAADDQTLIAANWLGKVRPDYHISSDGRVSPATTGYIRPYILPGITYPTQFFGDRVHPDNSTAPGDVSKLKVSIVVLTYNALEFTRQCVASLLEFTDARHELIFVDNASTDGTVDYLREMTAPHDQMQFIANETNLGFAAGNNVGMAAATGRHVILLNSDVVVTEGWVERLVHTAETNPRAGLVGPVTNNISGLQKLSDVVYEEDSLVGMHKFAAAQAVEHQGRVDHTLRLTGFCLLIKRELLSRIGGLAEVFGRGNYEDNDYCLRAHLAGFECLIARDCFIHHYGSRSFAAAGVDYVAQIHKQWDIFKHKWGIPAATPYNAPVDLTRLLDCGFDPAKHFEPLPDRNQRDRGVRETITAEG
ncbi:MAG: glycosyltransferase [Candidatus Krumholzibacteria bacterium]|nr:glycosyltransferase [Candidatus Krumholzibacteria bacterium]